MFSPFSAWFCFGSPWWVCRRLWRPWGPWRGRRSSRAWGRRWRASPSASSPSSPPSPPPPPPPPPCCTSSSSNSVAEPSLFEDVLFSFSNASVRINWNSQLVLKRCFALHSKTGFDFEGVLRKATSKAPISSVAETIAQFWTAQCSRHFCTPQFNSGVLSWFSVAGWGSADVLYNPLYLFSTVRSPFFFT